MSTRSAKAAQEAAVAAIAAAAAATAAADRAIAAAAQKGLRQEGDDMEIDNPIVDVAAAMQTPAVQAEMARQCHRAGNKSRLCACDIDRTTHTRTSLDRA
jgi:hypothetical protein